MEHPNEHAWYEKWNLGMCTVKMWDACMVHASAEVEQIILFLQTVLLHQIFSAKERDWWHIYVDAQNQYHTIELRYK